MTSLLEPAVAPVTAVATVVDNAKYAWDNSKQACLAALPDEFVFDFRPQLDEAAIAAIPRFLEAAWKSRGFEVQFGSWQELAAGNRAIWDETYWYVWDRAADALNAHDLVAAAELNDELNGYKELDD